MNIAEIIEIVEKQGATIKLHGDGLEVVNGQRLPLETVNLLKQHKPDLLAHLAAGGARTIEPLEHANDEPTPWERLKQRAMGAYEYELRNKISHLIQKGYSDRLDNAKVNRKDWRISIQRVMHLSSEQTDRLERELIQDGLLAYDNAGTCLVHGSGQTSQRTYRDNHDFILDDDTGRTFLNWLYS